MAKPLPIACLNGDFGPLAQIRISPLDRGFLFGDGVYEVIPVYAGSPFRLDHHLQRLANSLAAIRLDDPLGVAAWRRLIVRLIETNGGGDMSVYLQVTRGADTGRDHGFPAATPATVFAMCSRIAPLSDDIRRHGIAAITARDTRWERCDIKATSLLANVLSRQQALEAGTQEAILVRDGVVTEGAASSVFAVLDGVIVTPPNGPGILPGTTRDLLLELAGDAGMATRVAAIGVDQLRGAQEIWLAAATREVMPVTRLDDRPVGQGAPGPLWHRIHDLYQGYKRRLAETAA